MRSGDLPARRISTASGHALAGILHSSDSVVDGKRGSRAYCSSRRAEQPAFIQAGTIETTGAGDTFGACCLHYILEHGVAGFGTTELEEMLRFANAAASIVTTRRGALRVMPEPEEIQALLAEKSI